MILVKTSGIHIPKNYKDYELIKSNLTRKINGFMGESYEMKFYHEFHDYMLIPRYYPVDDNDFVVDKSSDGIDIEIESNITPRSESQKQIIEYLSNTKCGTLHVECGRGKTVCAIAAICNHKKKTLIIAHKDSLIDQWIDELCLHTTLSKDDIGRVYSNNWKKIIDKKIIIMTPHILANAVNNENKSILDGLNNCGIGLLISDEAHVTIGPQSFTLTSLWINVSRTIGLTATPQRHDGNEDLIQYHLGELKYIPPDENELILPLIEMIEFPFGIYEGKTIRYINWGNKFNYAKYYEQTIKSERYMDFITSKILEQYNQKRNILVLGYRIKTLMDMASRLQLPKSEIGIFIPSAKTKDIKKISDELDIKTAFKTKRIVFSTYGAARDGNSRSDLDCLFMTLPTSNVEQSIGRIQRYLNGKPIPLVFDFVDSQGPIYLDKNDKKNKSMFQMQAKKRMKFYLSKDWKVIVKKMDEKLNFTSHPKLYYIDNSGNLISNNT